MTKPQESSKAHQVTRKNLYLVNRDLPAADHLITELDDIIQTTGNLELSRQLNEISESYRALRRLIETP